MRRRRIRIQHQLREEIGDIIQNKLEDWKIKGSLITVTAVKITSDLKRAKVYISCLEGFERTKDLAEEFNHARGYIQAMLANNLELRFTPHLVFLPDDSIEYGTKVEQLLSELFPENERENTTDNQKEQ